MGCVVLDDHLYVLGGTNRHNEVLQSGERYSFLTDKWEDIPPMHHARYFLYMYNAFLSLIYLTQSKRKLRKIYLPCIM